MLCALARAGPRWAAAAPRPAPLAARLTSRMLGVHGAAGGGRRRQGAPELAELLNGDAQLTTEVVDQLSPETRALLVRAMTRTLSQQELADEFRRVDVNGDNVIDRRSVHEEEGRPRKNGKEEEWGRRRRRRRMGKKKKKGEEERGKEEDR